MQPPPIDNTYQIRPMSVAEVAQYAIEWAAEEGWNPGLNDAAIFYEADPQGFLLGAVAEQEVVATLSAVSYGDTFGFIGFYIVKPEFRGRGLGWRLWQEGMRRLEGRNIGLDGVLAQQENYAKCGFKFAYRNVRYELASVPEICPAPAHDTLIPVADIPFERLEAYDRAFFPAPRSKFLAAWLRQPNAYGVGYVEGNAVQGYGLLRPCRKGYKVGPLFADTPAVAETLLQQLLSHVPGETVYLDLPEVNPEAVAMAKRHGMEPVFETARMYTGEAPRLPLTKLYGITTFELG